MTNPELTNINDKEAEINKSTEEKQDAILAKMPTLESNGAIPVNIQDQTSTVVAFYMREVINTTTLSIPAVPNQNTITLTTGHGVVQGNTLVIKEGNNFFQADVLLVATDVITLDSPIDFGYQTTAIVQRCNKNLAVDGSTTPRTFFVSTAGLSVDVDITAVMFHMEDEGSMDASTFGSLPAITKGIVLRRKNGYYKNYLNAKTNNDLALFGNNLEFTDKIGGGQHSVACRIPFAGQHNYGVAVRLYYVDEDQLQVIVQDNISGLSKFNVIVQGHVVTN